MQNALLPPRDLSLRQHTRSLRSHLVECRRNGGAAQRLRCLGERVHGVLAPRLFTTVVAASLVLMAGSIWV